MKVIHIEPGFIQFEDVWTEVIHMRFFPRGH